MVKLKLYVQITTRLPDRWQQGGKLSTNISQATRKSKGCCFTQCYISSYKHNSSLWSKCHKPNATQLDIRIANRSFISPNYGITSQFPDARQITDEVLMYSIPKKAFSLLLGCSVVDNLYLNQTWVGNFSELLQRSATYAVYSNFCTTQIFPILCIDNWVKVRPCEWGIVAPGPGVNFKADIRVIGRAARQGWYANLGSKKYAERSISDCPIKLTTYCLQGIYIILQYLANQAAPIISHQDADWALQGETTWEQPQAYPAVQISYNDQLHITNPCTLMSYSYTNQCVVSPCYLHPHINIGDIVALTNFQGQTIQTAGIALSHTNVATNAFHLPASLNLLSIGELGIKPATKSNLIPIHIFPKIRAFLNSF